MGYVREFLSMMSDDGGKENSKRETVPSTAIGLKFYFVSADAFLRA